MARQLSLESLETRTLLAVGVTLLGSGELLIVGDDSANSVEVYQDTDQIVVDTGSGQSARFLAADVARLRFLGRDGDDRFANDTSLRSVAYGNQGNDTLIGGSDADRFHGGPGNDRLFGNDGDDELHGDHGDDLIEGGRGDDRAYGWYGNDVLIGGAGDDYLSGYRGNDRLQGGSGDDVLKGHDGDDLVVGDDGDDRLYGWKGNDILVGGDGDDYLSGWSGNDLIIGGKGDDVLRGHAGNDLLIGGKGTDRLDGGSDGDVLVGGWTMFDNNVELLNRILEVWSQSNLSSVSQQYPAARDAVLALLNRWAVKSDGKADEMFVDSLDLDWLLMDHKDFTTFGSL